MSRSDREKAHNSRARFEQWAKNPACEANVISAVYGLGMDVVSKAEGGRITKGQSPFAISRGKQFEKSLFYNNGERLIEELKRAGAVENASAVGFSDFRLHRDGGPLGGIQQALDASKALFKKLAQEGAKQPHLIAGTVVVIPGSKVMLPEAMLIIDALLILPSEGKLKAIVGEVKTYPDRDGFTATDDLATARAQAGIYVHALRLVLEDLGLGKTFIVSDSGFLVLSKPGSNYPSLRYGEDLKYMAERAMKGFERLRQVADNLKPKDPDELVRSIQNSSTEYREDCMFFCDRAHLCLEKLTKIGAPIILGETMDRFLTGLSLHRAIELMDRKDTPKNESESQFLEKVKFSLGKRA